MGKEGMDSIWGELKRRNVVKVAVAYAIVGWLLIEVASTVLPTFEAPQWVLQTITFLIILGFPLALVLSWVFDLTPSGAQRTESDSQSGSLKNVPGRKLDFAIIGALVLALGFVIYNYELEDGPGESFEVPGGVLPNSVAVLPLENLSPDPNNAYFAAGIHEAILNELAKISAMNVIARTSMLQYADRTTPIAEIARELNVETFMEGSVQYAGDRVRITAQLIDPETNAHLWSEDYDRDFVDVFAIQSDIAMNIANALEAEFSLAEQENIEQVPTGSPEAYAYFLQSVTAPNRTSRIAFLDQAIGIDSNFALAYARKAYLLSTLLGQANSAASPDEAAGLESSIRDSAGRALELDPTLGIAQAAIAVPLYVMTWRGVEAEQAFERAYELSPNDVSVLASYGRFKRHRGEFDEATRLLRRAVVLDPNNLASIGQLAINYRVSGNWDAAADLYADLQSRGRVGPATLVGLASVEAARGNHEEAVRQLEIAERLEPGPFRLGQMAEAYALTDRPTGRSHEALR